MNRRLNALAAPLAVLLALLTPALPALAADNITVKGSDTMVQLATGWAEAYRKVKPNVFVNANGGGTGTGFAALQNNTTDIADASRPIKAAERAACIKSFGKNPREYKVALDGLSVYVHADNPVNELSTDQLQQIFTGKARNWKEVGGNDAPITIYSRENSSGTYEFFKEHILKGQDFASSAQTMPGTAALLQNVSRDKNGIGYGGATYGHGAKARDHSRRGKERGLGSASASAFRAAQLAHLLRSL